MTDSARVTVHETLELTTHRQQCRHVRVEGTRCRSACLRGEPFCYFHHTARKPIALADREKRRSRAGFDLPSIEDRASVQQAIGMVLQRLAANALDPRRAGLLLYGLQIASINLPKAAQTRPNEENSQDDTVEDVTLDPSLGALAPEAAYTPPSRTRDLEEILLDGWKADDEAYARDQEDLRSSQDKDNILANVNAATGRGFNIGAGQIGEPERVPHLYDRSHRRQGRRRAQRTGTAPTSSAQSSGRSGEEIAAPASTQIPPTNRKAHPFGWAYPDLCRRSPNLPHTYACSTIGPTRLNFRVRDGNGCDPRGKLTGKMSNVLALGDRSQLNRLG